MAAMTASPDDIARLTRFAEELAREAGVIALSHFRSQHAVDNKKDDGGFDPVTIADRAIEARLRELIERAHPDHGVLGEEEAAKVSEGPWSWTLDPIDGTRGFITGFPMWTTLIACLYEGSPVIGVIDQPFTGERFVGRPEGSMYKRGGVERPMRVRPCSTLTDAVISTTDPYLFNPAEAGGFELVRQTAKLARYSADAYAYAMLADGRVDLVIETGLKPYDVHALIPVVRGAGGDITNWTGAPGALEGQLVAAGDPRARDEALVALRRAAD